jgi:hypothetical protein
MTHLLPNLFLIGDAGDPPAVLIDRLWIDDTRPKDSVSLAALAELKLREAFSENQPVLDFFGID